MKVIFCTHAARHVRLVQVGGDRPHAMHTFPHQYTSEECLNAHNSGYVSQEPLLILMIDIILPVLVLASDELLRFNI